MITALAASLGAAYAAPTTYTLDPAQSQLYVVVFNDPTTVGSGLGHDHAIVAQQFDGRVTWDPENPAACSVAISFPVTALAVDPPGYRDAAGLDPDGAVKDASKDKIKKNFLKPSQLNGSQFPTIAYQSTRCTAASGGRFSVAGGLTIRGVTKSVTVPMTVTTDGTTFEARGEFTATHEDFGFSPFSNLLGALRNKNEFRFVIDVKGRS